MQFRGSREKYATLTNLPTTSSATDQSWMLIIRWVYFTDAVLCSFRRWPSSSLYELRTHVAGFVVVSCAWPVHGRPVL